jgi:hypothetical protein
VAAGAIHLVMVPQHAQESMRMGVAFAIAGWCQVAAGAALLTSGRARWLFATIVSNLGFIAVWAVSRSAGLPHWSGDGGKQPASPVDVLCVVLEGLLVVVAIATLTAPNLLGSMRRALLVVAAVVPVGVMAATTIVLTAPSTAEHVHGSAGAGETAAHVHTDSTAPPVTDASGSTVPTTEHTHNESDITYAELPADTKAQVDAVIAIWQDKFPTAADAVAGGWMKATRSLYGIGAHYVRQSGLEVGTFDMLAPNILLYDGEGPDAKFAGLSYVVKNTPPEGFAGPYDVWHAHSAVCLIGGVVSSLIEENSDVWLSESDCLGRGGRLLPLGADQMMHLWIGPDYINSGPIMSHDHPLLLDGYDPQRDG